MCRTRAFGLVLLWVGCLSPARAPGIGTGWHVQWDMYSRDGVCPESPTLLKDNSTSSNICVVTVSHTFCEKRHFYPQGAYKTKRR